MRTLIAYATKSGASRECAQLLASKLKDCCLCNLSKQEPNIESYDIIILGSGVRMGKIYKPMKSFIEENTRVLLLKKIALFLCNSNPDAFQRVVKKNIPKELLDHAVCIESFGGIPPFNSMKNQEWILLDHVNRLVQSVALKE